MSRGLAIVLAFSMGFCSFMFLFALTVQDGLHNDALRDSLVIVPMALMFFAGSLRGPRLITRFGRAALSAGGVVQLAGLVMMVVTGWPDVGLLAMAAPLGPGSRRQGCAPQELRAQPGSRA